MPMTPQVMIVEDEEPLPLLLRYNLEAEGYRGRHGRSAATRPRRGCARASPDLLAARLDAARPVRHRALPPPARRARHARAADHHADRARRGERARARPRHRRRRLCRQAVLGARTDGARAARCCAAPSPSCSPTVLQGRRHRARPRDATASAAAAARSISARPSSACSNS